MNFEWTPELSEGQRPIGYIDIYSTIAKDHNVKIVIYYLPQFESYHNKKIVQTTIYFEGDKSELTDGLFHWIHDDICEMVKLAEFEKFKEVSNFVEILFTQIFTVNKIPDIMYFSHGDYKIEM